MKLRNKKSKMRKKTERESRQTDPNTQTRTGNFDSRNLNPKFLRYPNPIQNPENSRIPEKPDPNPSPKCLTGIAFFSVCLTRFLHRHLEMSSPSGLKKKQLDYFGDPGQSESYRLKIYWLTFFKLQSFQLK